MGGVREVRWAGGGEGWRVVGALHFHQDCLL